MRIETAYTSLLGLGLEIAAVSLFFSVYLCQCQSSCPLLLPPPTRCVQLFDVCLVTSSNSWFKKKL